MKTLSITFAFFAMAIISTNAIDTSICEEKMDRMIEFGLMDYIILTDLPYLLENVCEGQKDEDTCKLAILTYWPGVKRAVLGKEGLGSDICNAAGVKPADLPATNGCEECQRNIYTLSTIAGSQEFMDSLVDYLQGPAFCGSDSLSEVKHQDNCQGMVTELFPFAFSAMLHHLDEESEFVCKYALEEC